MTKSTYIRTTVRRCILIRTVENTMHLYLGWMHVQVDVLVLSSWAHMWIYKHAQPQIGKLQTSNNISNGGCSLFLTSEITILPPLDKYPGV
jgi:hypothetical protein